MKKSELNEIKNIISEGDDVQQGKNQLYNLLKGKAMVRDATKDTIVISTGDKYGVIVKIIGLNR